MSFAHALWYEWCVNKVQKYMYTLVLLSNDG